MNKYEYSLQGKISYRRLDATVDTDISAWLELHQLCFQMSMDRETWRWIHMNNPFYKKSLPLIIVAESEGKIVGSVSIIPSPLNNSSDKDLIPLSSCLVCKAMVHPGWRNRGIFSTLLKNAITISQEDGFDLLLTIANNPYSFRSFVRAGFIHISDSTQKNRYLSPDSLFKNYCGPITRHLNKKIVIPFFNLFTGRVSNSRHEYVIRYGPVAEVVKDIEDLHFNNPRFSGIYGLRNIMFTRWRFCREGGNVRCLTIWKKNQLFGYVVLGFSHEGKAGIILDLSVRDSNTQLFQILVNETINILTKNHAGTLSISLINRDWDLNRVFSIRNGFLKSHILSGKEKSHILYYCIKEKPGMEFLQEKNSWNLQACDTCLFAFN
jgi:hypothetical protein